MARFLTNVTLRRPALGGDLWRLLANTLRRNPQAVKHALDMASLYAHLGPFSRYGGREVRRRIAEVRADPGATRHRPWRGAEREAAVA